MTFPDTGRNGIMRVGFRQPGGQRTYARRRQRQWQRNTTISSSHTGQWHPLPLHYPSRASGDPAFDRGGAPFRDPATGDANVAVRSN